MIAIVTLPDAEPRTLHALAAAYVGGTGLAVTCLESSRYPVTPLCGRESDGIELRRLIVNGEPRVVVIVRHAARCNVDIMEGEP